MAVIHRNAIGSEDARYLIDDRLSSGFNAVYCQDSVNIIGREVVQVDELVRKCPHSL